MKNLTRVLVKTLFSEHGVKDGHLVPCEAMSCADCDFWHVTLNCDNKLGEWLEREEEKGE